MDPQLISPRALLTFRKANQKDATDLSKLITYNLRRTHINHYSIKEINIWSQEYTPNRVKQQIKHREVFIMENPHTILGTIQLIPQKIELKGFYINPDYKNVGFGKVLLGFIICQLKIARYRSVQLSSNKWSIPFYEKNGFEVIDKKVVHWADHPHPFVEWRMHRLIRTNDNNTYTKFKNYE